MIPDIMEKARELAETISAEDWTPGFNGGGLEKAINLIAAALAEARAVPDGWKLVPVEPTQAMLESGWKGYRDSNKPAPFNMLSDGYKAMIASAPNPPIAGGAE